MTPKLHRGKVATSEDTDKRKIKLPGGVFGTIRPRDDRWQADFGEVNGTRKRKSCKSIAEAEDWLREQALLLQNQGVAAFTLNDAQRLDAVQALEALKDVGSATLLQAANYFKDHHAPGSIKRISIADAVELYKKDAEARNLRPKSLVDIKYVTSKLVAVYGKRIVSGLSRTQAMRFIGDMPLSSRSKKHFWGICAALYNFCIDQEYCIDNPFRRKAGRARYEQDQTMPECLKVKDVEKLLNGAVEHEESLVAPLAIALFTGTRTAELRQLDWKDIDFDDRRILIRSEIAKKRRTRYLDMSPNLIQWILPYRKESGLIAPQGEAWRSRFEKLRGKIGMKDWPHNAMRHTFASMHLAAYEDAAKTAFALGHHRDTAQLFEHYRALTKKEDALAYWQIQPQQKENQKEKKQLLFKQKTA